MISGVLEIEIMNAVWDLQSQDEDSNISVGDIVDYLNNNNVERAYTTIKTVMDRLVTKALLARYKSGKKFFYRSTYDKVEVARETLREVTDQFFGGSQLQLMRFVEKECDKMLV
ncbi:BlaI/MecI/CopY family transcriptional regulator [bacterium]|jgi:predicted transcriptional regulator|nr:BlaI/MecI/CopY family transcriptional regulator [bacterium]